MGLLSAVHTSVNGLNATEEGFSVISNNIANLNTMGFKSNGVLFSDIYRSELDKVGLGQSFYAAPLQLTQGSVTPTENALDFALEGNGFFIVNDSVKSKEYYTRAGAFLMDNNAYVVNPDGFRLRGYMADASGVIGTAVSDIQIPRDANGNFTMAASATTTASMRVNLNAADSVASAWTFTSPSSTPPASGSYNYTAAMNVYDSEGNLHIVDTYFRKTAVNTWEGRVIYNSMKTSNSYREAGTISLTFDTSGNLTGTSAGSLTFTWGTDDWDGDSATANTTPAATAVAFDLANSTQYASAHSTALVQTDGYTSGNLETFSTNSKGIISGVYSNGRARNIAQLALATFRAATELERKGKNLYAVTDLSGPKTETKPGSGGAGAVFGSSLETSNVDLAKEFAMMISLQRAFQANSTAISTQLEMLRRMDNL
jgi:flagellar hook protein FlgE